MIHRSSAVSRNTNSMAANGGPDAMSTVEDLMPSDEDLLYEEELLRNPYSIKMWLRYLEAKTDAPAKRRYLLYERALKALPGSYKVGSRSCAVARFLRHLADLFSNAYMLIMMQLR